MANEKQLFIEFQSGIFIILVNMNMMDLKDISKIQEFYEFEIYFVKWKYTHT